MGHFNEGGTLGTARGFSIIEAIVATALLAVALVALAHLVVLSTEANRRSEASTRASSLATEKMEQLRGLMWGFDALGLPTADYSSDLTTMPERDDFGVGLTPSPAGALDRSLAGYSDFAKADGRTLQGAGSAPSGAFFERRWSIDPLPENPDTIVLQVAVFRVGDAATLVRLVTVRTRKS